MSGDLISRDTTMKMLREYAEVKFVCGQIELANGILKAVNYIENDNIPIAYDVDKVVERLEILSDSADDKIMKQEGFEQYWDGFGDGVDEAIKVVKGGGLNG